MAKATWFDERAEHPTLHERVEKLESFTAAMADGVVDKTELNAQEQRLAAAMKTLEPKLSDELHGQVTNVLIELTAAARASNRARAGGLRLSWWPDLAGRQVRLKADTTTPAAPPTRETGLKGQGHTGSRTIRKRRLVRTTS